MSLATQLLSESNAPATRYSVGETVETLSGVGAPCPVLRIDLAEPPAPEVPANYTEIGELVRELESDPAHRSSIEQGRQWLAGVLEEGEGATFRALRLRRGLSQSALAKLIGTQQPHVARIERGSDNITVDTFRRLAHALEVDLNTLNDALALSERDWTRRCTK